MAMSSRNKLDTLFNMYGKGGFPTDAEIEAVFSEIQAEEADREWARWEYGRIKEDEDYEAINRAILEEEEQHRKITIADLERELHEIRTRTSNQNKCTES